MHILLLHTFILYTLYVRSRGVFYFLFCRCVALNCFSFSFLCALLRAVSYVAQGVPLVNIIESIDGEERFVTAVDTTGYKKDMQYLADLMDPHIDQHVDLIASDGACGGMLTILEKRHPRYAAVA